MTLNEKSKKLRRLLFNDDLKEFRQLLDDLLREGTSKSAEYLICALQENDDYMDEMYQILHAAESVPMEQYLGGFLSSVVGGTADNYWVEMLLLRIMNDGVYLSRVSELAKELDQASREILKEIAISASIRRPEFKDRSTAFIIEIS